MKIYIFINLFLLLPFIASSQGSKKEFKVFDATQYENTPELSEFGFHKINVFYERDLMSEKSYMQINGKRLRRIDVIKLIRASQIAKQNPSAPVCLDLETWKKIAGIKTTEKAYLYTLQYFRSLVPRVNVSIYSYRFKSDSIVYKSFYTPNNNKKWWLNRVKRDIGQLREEHPEAKVYAFIWPQYQPLGRWGLDLEFLPASFWRFQLDTLYKYADGIVIWSPNQLNKKHPISFSYDMPWVKESIAFIKKKNIK